METLAWNKERFISGLESGKLLPSLSPLTMRLIELASDDNSSLNDIAALIEKDPSLTIRILKLANSVFFRYGNPVKTRTTGSSQNRDPADPTAGPLALAQGYVPHEEGRCGRLPTFLASLSVSRPYCTVTRSTIKNR